MQISEALGKVGVKNTESIKEVENLIGAVSPYISMAQSAIATTEKIGQLLGLWKGRKDPIDDKFRELTAAINDLKTTVLDATRVDIDINKRTFIGNLFGPIYTAVDKANDFRTNPSEDQNRN